MSNAKISWYILDDSDEPVAVDMVTGAVWIRTSGDRRVLARTQVADMNISTVFLCIDHGFQGPPVLWETLIFGGPLAGEVERYQSKAEAIEGHLDMVRKALGHKLCTS